MSRLSRSLKVNGTDIYDFLLTCTSNRVSISFHFRDKRRFQYKISHIFHPVYLALPLKGFPLELGTSALDQRTQMMWLPGRDGLDTYVNVIDGRTETGRQQRPRLRIASRDKNKAASLPDRLILNIPTTVHRTAVLSRRNCRHNLNI